MKTKIFQNIFFSLLIFISLEITAQTSSAVSIISTDIFFLRTEIVKSSHGPIYKGYATQVVTYYNYDHYALKFSVKINERIDSPLDLKLISPQNEESIYRIEENLNLLNTEKIYSYNLDVILKDIGWYEFQLGDFTKNINEEFQNVIFDKTTIYVEK
jgi:hypothetical protein